MDTNFEKVLVRPVNYTIGTIIHQMIKGQIDATTVHFAGSGEQWTQKKSCLFIESLLMGIPSPSITLVKRSKQIFETHSVCKRIDPPKNEKGTLVYDVLDGRQILFTLLEFTGNDPSSPHNNFKLRDLKFLTQLEGQDYQTIVQDSSFFENIPISVSLIENYDRSDDRFLDKISVRLNQR
jgi:uncharacterized protein with ParB-like and HNH nuclease domain